MSTQTHPIELDDIWAHVIATTGQREGIHGAPHWARVERNGMVLVQASGANPVVVSLFALFHDSQRMNDGHDPSHGERGAALATSLRAMMPTLDDAAFDLLTFACSRHTDQRHHDDPTIATCWDADRLDLGRVGMVPDPAFLNTQLAREIAGGRGYSELEAHAVRAV